MTGIIYRISGPVVTVEGLENAKMYDVVRVGEQSLIGEIIKLDNGKAIVQVYEDTTGLRPGEAVENTNVPLSVVLGPGLMGSIYDGIQRPLDKIQKQSGDFIARGVNVDALDTKKKWEFNPKVKKGDKVKEGDIIGEVDETSLIKHRVMVPIGMEGTVEDIKHSSFTISDTVAVIKTKDGDKEVKLAQRWPVRIARPVKSKLPPNIPLITGQRIIDTLFPVAKGGTAAVPGPFGSGKCVGPETPILTADGGIMTIEEAYTQHKDKARVQNEGNDEWLFLNSEIQMQSLHVGKIRSSKTRTLYRGKSDSLIKITTRSGREVRVTPVHKLFAIKENGMIAETMAKDLKLGSFIASARKLDIKNDNRLIDVYKISGVRTIDPEIRTFVRESIIAARKNGIPIPFTEATKDSLVRKDGVTPRLEWIKAISDALGLPVPRPLFLVGNRASTPIKIPERTSDEFAEFIGYYVSEGYLRGKATVVFTNLDEKLLERFCILSEQLFGLKGKIERQQDKTPNVLLNSTVLASFLKSIGAGRTSREKAIPDVILKSCDSALAAFLGSYFEGDGSFSGSEAEFCTASKKLQLHLSYALTRLGILHTLRERVVNGDIYNRILVHGIRNLQPLSAALGSETMKKAKLRHYVENTHPGSETLDIVPLSRETIESVYNGQIAHNALERAGIEISNYTVSGERMSSTMFKKFVSVLVEKSGSQLVALNKTLYDLAIALEYVYCDEISKIEVEKGPFDVYDASLPEYGMNFVGGFGGIILHNTVIQHQLAKWSDSEIVVYVGCGERGNEMTEILKTFPELKDPKTGKPLMDRTILIANTSNMPVAAREASIYTGITLAEYYRDMGYNVALMADSTSRWAEALREISGRLEEMPGEEGYPAYLGRKVAEFYERAGRVNVLNGSVASITAIGAVSPPGGDTSEPVSQATLRVTRVFWALDASLANRRHFPSINWLNSYSLYIEELKDWYEKNAGAEWNDIYSTTMELLQKEAEINEIVQLVGYDALPEKEKMVLDIAKVIREDYLQQSAFDEVDTFTSINKQNLMLKSIISLYNAEKAAVERGVFVDQLQGIPAKLQIARMKFTKEEEIDAYYKQLQSAIEEIGDLKAQTK